MVEMKAFMLSFPAEFTHLPAVKAVTISLSLLSYYTHVHMDTFIRPSVPLSSCPLLLLNMLWMCILSKCLCAIVFNMPKKN